MELDFFDDFNSIFNALTNRFNRPVREVNGFTVFKSPGKGFVVVCNTLGINKDDLKVGIEKQKGRAFPILKVKGSTTIENIGFKNSVDLAIELKFDSEIENINYKMENGLTIVYIKLKNLKEEKPQLKANFIDSADTNFDW